MTWYVNLSGDDGGDDNVQIMITQMMMTDVGDMGDDDTVDSDFSMTYQMHAEFIVIITIL